MDKKLTLGLFALLFITSGVQSLAISKIQANKVAKNSTVALATSSNQQATASLYDYTTTLESSDPSVPTPQGYMVNPRGECSFYLDRGNYRVFFTGGVVLDGGANSDSTEHRGCGGASVSSVRRNAIITAPVDLIVTLPSIDSKDRNMIASGGVVTVMQFKLALLGYMNFDQISGNLDETTKSAVMTLQKSTGLSATGNLDTKTATALDLAISKSGVLSTSIDGTFISK